MTDVHQPKKDEIKRDGHTAHEDELDPLEGATNEGGFQEEGPAEAGFPEDTDGMAEENSFNQDTQ